MRELYPIGTLLQCPACGLALMKLIQPVNQDEILKVEQVQGLNGFQPESGIPIRCPECKSYWVVNQLKITLP